MSFCVWKIHFEFYFSVIVWRRVRRSKTFSFYLFGSIFLLRYSRVFRSFCSIFHFWYLHIRRRDIVLHFIWILLCCFLDFMWFSHSYICILSVESLILVYTRMYYFYFFCSAILLGLVCSNVISCASWKCFWIILSVSGACDFGLLCWQNIRL